MKNKVKVNVPLSVFNDVYLKEKILECENRYLLIYGGAGSGKSFFIAQMILLRLLQQKGVRFLVVRKVARTLRNSVFLLFKDLITSWKLDKLFTINKSDMMISCLNGNSIIFVGLDDPEKLKSIQGITSIWIEEASELNAAAGDFSQLDLRLRGETKNKKQIILSFNPISEHNWIKKTFFDREVEDTKILKTTYLDNKFIDDDYHKLMNELKERDPIYYAVYALGEWGVLGSMVYNNYQVKEISRNERDYEAVYNGLDFGFNDPSAMVKVGIKDDELYILDEFYESGLTNTELIDELLKRGKLKKNDYLICDSAEQDRIKQFKQAGFSRMKGAKKGAGSIMKGIEHIRQHKLYISPSCKNFIREIQSYKYRTDKDGNVFEEPDHNCEDHLLDALRYAMELKKSKREVKAGLSLY